MIESASPLEHEERVQRLTSHIGRPVITDLGQQLGVVVDMTVRLGETSGKVHRIGVGRRRRVEALVELSSVAEYGDRAIRLDPAAQPVALGEDSAALASDELLLVRDVLDTQIIDVDGQRVERVGDVLMVPMGSSGLLAVAAEVGRRPVLRRLGLRRTAERLPVSAVAWQDLHLTSARGHRVQLTSPVAAMHRLDADELAAVVARLSTQHAADVLTAISPERAVGVLEAAHPDVAARVVAAMDGAAAEPVVTGLGDPTRQHLERVARRPIRRRFRRHRGHAPWRRPE